MERTSVVDEVFARRGVAPTAGKAFGTPKAPLDDYEELKKQVIENRRMVRRHGWEISFLLKRLNLQKEWEAHEKEYVPTYRDDPQGLDIGFVYGRTPPGQRPQRWEHPYK